MNKRIRLLGCLTVMLSAHAIPGHAAFFQLQENGPAGLGNAFAGGAAIAEDASTVWYNPAGLTRLSRAEYLVGGYVIVPSTKVKSVSGSTTVAVGGSVPVTGGNGGDAGEDAIVPNFYYSRRLNDQAVFGFGVNVPFGLATEYDSGWVGRYHALRSEIKTINLNPAIGYEINSQLSVGGGFNVQFVDAILTQAIDFGTICTALAQACGPRAGNDGNARIKADNVGYGFNLGLLWSPQSDTRLGFAYRSKVNHKLEGTADIDAPANVVTAGVDVGRGIVDSGAMAYVTFPETISLSIFRELNSSWDIMADVTRTRWSRLPELRIDFDSAQPDSVVTLGLKDVNRYSIGANYRPGGSWIYRFGVALDNTPTPNESLRTPRLPDQDRTWFAVGAGYKQNADFSFDVSFVHIKIDDADISKSAGTSSANENFFRGNLTASYEADVNILSAQARWTYK